MKTEKGKHFSKKAKIITMAAAAVIVAAAVLFIPVSMVDKGNSSFREAFSSRASIWGGILQRQAKSPWYGSGPKGSVADIYADNPAQGGGGAGTQIGSGSKPGGSDGLKYTADPGNPGEPGSGGGGSGGGSGNDTGGRSGGQNGGDENAAPGTLSARLAIDAETYRQGYKIMSAKTVSFSEGETVFDVLYRECRESKIHMASRMTPFYNGAYIEGIDNLYEFDAGELSGWMYSVNGWYPNYGSSQYYLSDGDVIAWRYTCDLGRDIGAGYAAGG